MIQQGGEGLPQLLISDSEKHHIISSISRRILLITAFSRTGTAEGPPPDIPASQASFHSMQGSSLSDPWWGALSDQESSPYVGLSIFPYMVLRSSVILETIWLILPYW
jgi:hypothetical protein